MSKYSILNFSLLMAIVALVAFIIYDPTEQITPSTQPLTNIQSSEISTIKVLQHEHIKVRLQKQQTNSGSDYWAMISPLNLTASTLKVDRIKELLLANSVRQYTVDDEQLTKFGLNPPQWQIHFDQHVISLGNTDAINQNRYALYKNKNNAHNNKVHLIHDRHTHAFADLPLSLANLELLPFNKGIREIITPAFHLKQQDGKWQLDPAMPVDSQDDINALVDEWRYAQALRLSLNPPTAPDAQHSPRQQITIITAETSAPIHFVLVAKENDIKLIREDLGVSYHMSNSARERLLHIPAKHTTE